VRLHGIFGRPFIDLAPLIDTSRFAAMDREITLGLAELTLGGTGATLKSMGVVAPWVMGDGRRDAMDAIRAMTDEELADFVALGDEPVDLSDRASLAFGDETDRPFTLAQQRLLEMRHGVYFP